MKQSASTKYLRRIQLESVRIAYTDQGDGDPILFIHGSWDDHHSWDGVADLLSDEYRVITYDRRGHSASTTPPGQGRMGQDVSDALELIENLGLSSTHLVGHSYGASVAIELASSSPDSTKSLFIHEPPVFSLLDGNPECIKYRKSAALLMNRSAELIEKGEIEEAARLFIEQVAFGEGSWEQIFDKAAHSAILSNVDTWLDQFRDPERLAVDVTALRHYRQRITLSTGTNTLPAYSQIVQQLIRILPSLKVAEITGGGHGAHISHPTEIANAIRAHLLPTNEKTH